MELRHLRYFVAVAEELNFRKAAERLRVAQPALSSQIKDLEADVGAQLLDRDTSHVRLTDAGTVFLDETRVILARAEQAVAMAREAAKGHRGRLTVGYFAPIFMGLMPASLKVFREKFPDVEVALLEMPSADQMAALESGLIQIAFIFTGSVVAPPNIKSSHIGRSSLRVAMGRGHRLARVKCVPIDELKNEPLLCFTPRKGLASVHAAITRRVFSERKLKLKSLQVIEGVEAFRATLESGIGVSLVPETGNLSAGANLVVKPLKETGDDLETELHALSRADQSSQLVDNFIAVVQSVVPDRPRGNNQARRPIDAEARLKSRREPSA